MLGQMAGMNMQMMARSLLIYRLTDSATALGIMGLANAVPMVFFSLFGGVIADRVQKKYVLLAGQISSGLISLVIALFLTFDLLGPDKSNSWWILIIAALFQGTVMGLMMPSRQTIIRDLVGREQLMNAISLNTLGMNSLRLVAPAMAGFLIEVTGFSGVYYAMTFAYIIAVVFTLFLPLTGTISLKGNGTLTYMAEGFSYIRRDKTILLILLVTLFAVILSMPYMMLLPVFTEDILKVGAGGMGILVSFSGMGAIAGSLILASLPNKKRGLMLILSGLLMGFALIAFSFSESWYLSLFAMIFIGVGQTARMALSGTLLQYYSEPDYRGRVMSFMMMEFGLSNFAVFIAAVMSDIVGVQWTVGSMAILLVFMSIGALILIPRIRRLD
jgi:MFS family permease